MDTVGATGLRAVGGRAQATAGVGEDVGMALVFATIVDALTQAWQRASTVQPPPEPWAVPATAALALACVLVPALWRRTRHLVTLVHEASHAVVAVLTGRRLAGIRLHSDTSGLTVSVGRPRGPGMVATAAAGYVGPAAVGLGTAWLLGRGYAVGVLWFVLAMIALMLLAIRNLFGLWVLLAVGAVLVLATGWAPVAVQVALAYTLTWFLLLGAPRAVAEVQAHRARERRAGRPATSDADALARLTPLPAAAWVGIFWLLAVMGLGLGARWLLAPAAA